MKRSVMVILLFLICTATSFFMKTCHYNREAARLALQIGDAEPVWYGSYTRLGTPGFASWKDALPFPRRNFIPHTIESAMMYAYSRDVATGRGVPKRDLRLAYLPDVPPYAQMNMLLEWVLGWSWRIYSAVFSPAPPAETELRFQDHPAFARFAAVEVRLWTSLIPGLIFLWLIAMRTPLKYSFAAGMLHALSAASIARATGQDIVRGDLCIPLFMLCLTTAYSIYSRPARWKYVLLFLGTFAAFAAWDLCQMLFGAWLWFDVLRRGAGGRVTARRRNVWIVMWIAVVLNALIVPFNVTYGLIMSPLICVFFPLLLIALFVKPQNVFWKRLVLLTVSGLTLWGVWKLCIDNPVYRANYSHFSEAMIAKLKFDNKKPLNPQLLSYDARIMWTPSMHSATWPIAAGFFPSPGSSGMQAVSGPTAMRNVWNFLPLTLSAYFLLLLIAGLFTVFRVPVLHDLPRSLLPHLFTTGFLIGFIYIVRYHEFLIIFLSASLMLLIQEYFRGIRNIRGTILRRTLAVLLVCWISGLLLFEGYVTACCRSRSYSRESYNREISKLIEWLRRGRSVQGKTILTEFTVGPMLMAYCGANLVLQPQFGMEPIRRPVEEYIHLLFHGNEMQLSAFCSRYGVDYLLFDHGAVGPMLPDSLRYIGNAPEILPGTPAALMEHRPDTLRHFYRVEPPRELRELSRKYVLFKYISPAAVQTAAALVRDGRRALHRKDFADARKNASAAIVLDPCSEKVRNFYIRLFQQIPEPGPVDFQRGMMRSQEGTR